MDPLRGCATAAAAILMALMPALPPGMTTASATPSSGVQAVTLSQNTVDGIEYTTREITIAPGGSTGWHFHEPIVYGTIRSGTLTRTLADCRVDATLPAGAAVAEGQGSDHVHVGRNLGTEPLVMWVSYVAPVGTPLSVDVPDPGCGFA